MKNDNEISLAELEYNAIKQRYAISIIADYIVIGIAFICCIWSFIESHHNSFGWLWLTVFLSKINSLQYYYKLLQFAHLWYNEVFNKPQQSTINNSQLTDILSGMRDCANKMEAKNLYDLRELGTDYLRAVADRIEDVVNNVNRTNKK
jgi:hypothetical protein